LREKAVTKLLLVTKSLAGTMALLMNQIPHFLTVPAASHRERMLFYKQAEGEDQRRHKEKQYLGLSEPPPPTRKVRFFCSVYNRLFFFVAL
jgi:hypothetical protein